MVMHQMQFNQKKILKLLLMLQISQLMKHLWLDLQESELEETLQNSH